MEIQIERRVISIPMSFGSSQADKESREVSASPQRVSRPIGVFLISSVLTAAAGLPHAARCTRGEAKREIGDVACSLTKTNSPNQLTNPTDRIIEMVTESQEQTCPLYPVWL